jgi:FKBP-type peptidyl-prolyl cis-trans isomerase 2
MQTAQKGDRVQVNYVKRWQDGSVVSSSAPLELTVGSDSRRLPGLGLTLVGLAPGHRATLTVPAGQAYGESDPDRVYRLRRNRFAEGPAPVVGRRMRIADRKGRRRLVRILEVSDKAVVVDTNHPRAGQALKMEVELVAIHAGQADAARPPA